MSCDSDASRLARPRARQPCLHAPQRCPQAPMQRSQQLGNGVVVTRRRKTPCAEACSCHFEPHGLPSTGTCEASLPSGHASTGARRVGHTTLQGQLFICTQAAVSEYWREVPARSSKCRAQASWIENGDVRGPHAGNEWHWTPAPSQRFRCAHRRDAWHAALHHRIMQRRSTFNTRSTLASAVPSLYMLTAPSAPATGLPTKCNADKRLSCCCVPQACAACMRAATLPGGHWREARRKRAR